MGGTNLMKTEFVGKSDPYIVVEYGDKTFKSKTVKNNQNPVWNFDFEFPVIEKQSEMKLSIFDEDIGKDDTMGEVLITIDDLIKEKQVINKCFKLQNCKSGEIYLSSAYNSDILPDEGFKSKDLLISGVTEENSAKMDELKMEVDAKSSKVEKPLIKKDDHIKSSTELKENQKFEKK